MDGLDQKEFDAKCREVFYANIDAFINDSNQRGCAAVLDFVRGKNRLIQALWPLPDYFDTDRPMLIYPPRVYEKIEEVKHGKRSSS